MNAFKEKVIILAMAILLNGCGIGGHWMTGNPFSTPPKSYLEYWQREGGDSHERRRASIECGAVDNSLQKDPDGYPVFSDEDIEAVRGSNEELIIAQKRLRADWQRCMINKGYTISEEWMLLTDDY